MLARDSLLPWKTALGNAMFGMEVRGVPRAQAEERARAMLQEVGLAGFENTLPKALSHGMRQRVALARTFSLGSPLLLMDEPFGALDALTRAALQDELNTVMAKTGATVVMVTHDVDEAVLLSDRIVMMTNGPAATIGEILEVKLDRPRERLALAHDITYTECRASVLDFL